MREDLTRVAAAARDEGRTALFETEVLELARAVGLTVPAHLVVTDAADVARVDLSELPGARVVVKVLSSEILHRTDVGGVAIVPKTNRAVAAEITAMEGRFAVRDVAGFLIVEFVEHDLSFGGELLLGARWTADFGPVVTLGPGGTDAEFVAHRLRAGEDIAVLAPGQADPTKIRRAVLHCAVGELATKEQRGRPPRVPAELLETCIARLLDAADRWMPHELVELEFNPVVATPRGLVALDALARLSPPQAAPTPARPLDKVRRLLEPRSIALIGVSRRRNPGHVMLENVLAAGFPRERVHVVKPGVPEIAGCACVADIASLPERVDVLVVAVDAAQVPEVVRDVVDHEKAESLIVIPGGLGEREGSEGHASAVRAALDASRGTAWGGPVVNGANCLGIRSRPGRYDTLFIPQHKLGFPGGDPEPVAFLSQSGAFAVARSSELDHLEPRYVVTFGNQLDLTVGDFLTVLADDPEVEVFPCYVEGFRPGDGRQWLEAAARATSAGKAVILYRAGRSAAGASAAASHTASIAGDYSVTHALAEQAGVLVAETIGEFGDLVRLALGLRHKRVAGMRLGAVTNAGFECVAIGDALGPFQLASFAETTRARLSDLLEREALGSIVAARNPVDLTPIAGDAAYEDAARAVLSDAGVDIGVIGCVPLTGALNTLPGDGEDLAKPDSVVQRLLRLHAESSKAWIAVVDGGARFDPMARELARAGVPTFRRADRALRMFARYCTWRRDHGRSTP